MDAKTQLAGLFQDALKEVVPEASATEIHFERPRDPAHGDLATNVAMQLARQLKRNPRQIAEALLVFLRPRVSGAVDSMEIAGAGFINIRLKSDAKVAIVRQVLDLG